MVDMSAPAANSTSPRRRGAFQRETAVVRRGALIEATIRCLGKKGADGISVRNIAAEAGVSAGLVAHHFGGIDTLIADSYRVVTDRVEGVLAKAAAAAGPDPRRQLADYVTASFQPPVLDPSLLATWVAFWRLNKSNVAVAEAHRDIYGAYRSRLEILLQACGLPDPALRLSAIALTALIDGLWLELCLDDSAFTADDARHIVEQALTTLLASQGASR
jgi:AcrR family transcriptional regulator